MSDSESHWKLMSPEEIRGRSHPNFQGDRGHLERFIELASSEVRTDDRQNALVEWISSRRLPAKRKIAWPGRTEKIDLRGANLKQVTVGTADLRLCNFDGADMRASSFKAAMFQKSTFRTADLRNALLMYADFRGADLTDCKLQGADLTGANLTDANLAGAELRGANLEYAQVVKSDLTNADLSGCKVYGAGVWRVKLNENTRQEGLIVDEPFDDSFSQITVNGCNVAQFIHLFLDPDRIYEIISTTTNKLVLILGNFSEDRKAVLDDVRRRLPDYDQVGIEFDFEFLDQSTMLETILTLAQMSRFTIADLTEPKLVVDEVTAILDRLSGQIIQPIHSASSEEIMELRKIGQKSWNTYLPAISYEGTADLIGKIPERILPAVEQAAAELAEREKFARLPGRGRP